MITFVNINLMIVATLNINTYTFVSKALWYRTFKKTRLLPDLKLLRNVPHHSLFKFCKFHEKINGQFFARAVIFFLNVRNLQRCLICD